MLRRESPYVGPAVLALADGRVFRGQGFGARVTRVGEVVFNTSMTGYQEILTDPSYEGQIVCLTAPEIGNVGVNAEDDESRGHGALGLIVRSLSPVVSNWRAEGSLHEFLVARGVPGIGDLDTRALTRHLRETGSIMGTLSTEHAEVERLVELARNAPSMAGQNLAAHVSTKAAYDWDQPSWGSQPAKARDLKVVAWDFGLKESILRYLVDQGCDVHVVPASTTAAEILAMAPHGVFLSNGPGDPSALPDVIGQIRELIERAPKLPIFGICLGHQLLCLALGGETYKLKFGHHGGNHPVRDLVTGRVAITAQNHGFAARADTMGEALVSSHTNLFDETVAGLRVRDRPIFAVQYHPEASPGPRDSLPLFAAFAQLMRTLEPTRVGAR